MKTRFSSSSSVLLKFEKLLCEELLAQDDELVRKLLPYAEAAAHADLRLKCTDAYF